MLIQINSSWKKARVLVSPLRHTLLNNYNNLALSNSSHPKVTKCNSNRCLCCRFLYTGSTVSSFVNRTFSCLLPHNSSWNSINVIHVITWQAPSCGMQYVGQTGRKIKERFREHIYKIKMEVGITVLFIVILN